MRHVFDAKQWIKELVKRDISKFSSKDLKDTDLYKPHYYYKIAHEKGWLYRAGIKFSLSIWTLTSKAKQL